MDCADDLLIQLAMVVAETIGTPTERHDLRATIAVFSGLRSLHREIPAGARRLRATRHKLTAICAAHGVALVVIN